MALKEYAYIKHNNTVATGTIPELAKKLELNPDLLRYWANKTHHDRVKRGVSNEYLKVIKEPATEEYALYKGENLVSMGTMAEIAKETGKDIGQIRWYATPSARKRNLSTVLVKLEEDEG